MIFVTVGVQLPFDRLVRAVDAWAGERMRADVFAQIGPSQYRPQHIEFRAFVQPPEFRRLVEGADAVVAHAGMGSIITALELAKPLIVMPRRAELGEHRNDHQLSTARHMLAQNVISVAKDEIELMHQLDQIKEVGAARPIPAYASGELIETISSFLAACGKR
jgi:exopolysaccharide biosynthesis glucuronosyltransferase PssE